MSQENVEYARRAFQAFNERGLAGAAEFWHPQIVWETDPSVPEPGTYTGFDAVRTYLEGFIRAFGAWHIDPLEVIDLGGDEVLSVLTVSGHPLGQTDEEAHFLNWAWIVSIRDGQTMRIRSFLDIDTAFAAAGLAE